MRGKAVTDPPESVGQCARHEEGRARTDVPRAPPSPPARFPRALPAALPTPKVKTSHEMLSFPRTLMSLPWSPAAFQCFPVSPGLEKVNLLLKGQLVLGQRSLPKDTNTSALLLCCSGPGHGPGHGLVPTRVCPPYTGSIMDFVRLIQRLSAGRL